MSDWDQLLLVLDKTVGFPNKIRSSVKKRWQGYDQWKNEHVIWLEYRIRVSPGSQPPRKPPQNLRDLHGSAGAPLRQTESLTTIRELMDVGFVGKVNSPASPPSTKKAKVTTAKAAVRPKRIQRKS